jgi:hypothetical protein
VTIPGFLQHPIYNSYQCTEITGNKIILQNFISRWADELRPDYIMTKRSATVPDQDEPSPSSKLRQCQVAKR